MNHTQNILISIVVPIYKVELYLEECLNSIINQTYKFLDIILVDDGSPDNSGIICDNYAKKDSRIRVIHKSNGGLSDARNYGLKYANGQYISFIDSDDAISYDFYERLINRIENNDVDIVECDYIKFTSIMPSAEYYNKEKEFNSKDWITETNLNGFLSCVAWNKIYKKELFNNIEYPKGLHFEDEATTYKLVFKAKKIIRIYDKLYFYRQRENSITSSKLTLKDLNDKYNVLYEKCIFFHNAGEFEIESFCYSKLILMMISNYKQSLIYDLNWKSLIKNYYKMITQKRYIPLKYTMYIKLFILFPSLIGR